MAVTHFRIAGKIELLNLRAFGVEQSSDFILQFMSSVRVTFIK